MPDVEDQKEYGRLAPSMDSFTSQFVDQMDILEFIQIRLSLLRLINNIMEIPRQFLPKFDCEFEQAIRANTNNQQSINNCATENYQSYSNYESNFTFQKIFKPLKQGYLKKKTLNFGWKQCYFILTPYRLIYFSDNDIKRFKGCFNFISLMEHKIIFRCIYPQIQFVLLNEDDENLSEKILLSLKFQNGDVFGTWVSELSLIASNLIELSKQYPLLSQKFCHISKQQITSSDFKIGMNLNSHFWNRIDISIYELYKYVTHLDLLFIKTKSPAASLFRLFIGSEYDHVGLLIKNQADQVFILESVKDEGVKVSNLRNLINYSEQFQLGYRKLICKDSQFVQLESLEKYLNSLLGKKYELSIPKLIGNNEEQIEENQNQFQQKNQVQNKTYFCTQLIADIYLKFKILKSGKSHSYWPKDFENSQINFSQSYSLSPLMKINFQTLLVQSQKSVNEE